MRNIIIILSLALVLSSCVRVQQALRDYADDPNNRQDEQIFTDTISDHNTLDSLGF